MQLSQGYLLWLNKPDLIPLKEQKQECPQTFCPGVQHLQLDKTVNLGQVSCKRMWQHDPQHGHQTGVQEQPFASNRQARKLLGW